MANSYIERKQGKDYLVAEIDLYKCLTKNGMYVEFDEAFSFPESKNKGSIDVLLDFMRDLGWQKVKNYEVRFNNSEKALKKDATNVKDVLILVNIIKKYWLEKKDKLNAEFEFDFIFDYV